MATTQATLDNAGCKVTCTPGPWEFRAVTQEMGAIARVGYMPHATVNNPLAGGSDEAPMRAEDVANAVLMAAAPELLAALLCVRNAFYVQGKPKAVREALDATHDLIAGLKAKGVVR
jgi:hypothetical protein